MGNEQALVSLVEKIVNACKDEFKESENIIDSIPEFSLPTYSQMKDPEAFIESSTTFTQMSSIVHLHKVKLSKLNIDITTLWNEISKYKLNSIYQKALNDLKQNRDKCAMYIDTLNEYQRSIDQVLQHLKLCSYTINSYYVE